MMVTIELISDFICPWCYLGKVRLERIQKVLKEEDIDLVIDLKPYILYPHIPPGGLDKSWFAKKSKPGMGKTLKHEAQKENIEINYNHIKRIPYSMDAHRLMWMIPDLNTRFEVANRIFRDYFELGQDIEEKAYLKQVGESFAISSISDSVNSDSTLAKTEVLQSIKETFDTGISLVPTLRFGPSINLPGLQPYEIWMTYIRRAIKLQNPK